MPNHFVRSALLSCGFVLFITATSQVAQAQFFGNGLKLTVRTGGDDLRGSSRAMISVQHPDGTWSTEKEFSTGGMITEPFVVLVTCDTSGCQKFPPNTTYEVTLTNWDGVDPCAKQIRVRLAQGACFLCTDDNWNMDSIQVAYSSSIAPSFTMGTKTGAYLTGSGPTVTFAANPIPAGTVCQNGQTADCSGNPFNTAVLTGNQPFDKDSVCDNGPSGFNFMCETFLYDSGACGIPPGWPPACNGYYSDGQCDCNDCGGIWDPDCNDPNINNPSRTVWNCGAGRTCINQVTSAGASPICFTSSVAH